MTRTVPVTVATCLLGLLILGCPPRFIDFEPEFVVRDAGDYSWVRQVVPLLFGRKVRGHDELKVLADLTQQTSRQLLLELLIRRVPAYSEEYVDHWSENLVDFLRIHRETSKSQSECFGSALRSLDNRLLAVQVRNRAPGAGPVAGGPFNMSDLLRSALLLDDLSPVYRAYLFPMVNKPLTGNEVLKQTQRDDLGAAFGEVYVRRQATCLACHTTPFSQSGEETFWNRHLPIFGAFELALYGSHFGHDTRELHALFRTDVTQGNVEPWGMKGCGTFSPGGSVAPDPLEIDGGPIQAYFVEEQGDKATVWELEQLLHQGYRTLLTDGLVRAQDQAAAAVCDSCSTSCAGVVSDPQQNAANEAAANQVIADAQCTDCHIDCDGNLCMTDTDWQSNLIRRPSADFKKIRVIPGQPAASLLMQRVTAPESTRMPPSWYGQRLDNDEVEALRNWIKELPEEAGCKACDEVTCVQDSVDGAAGFGYLVAANAVNQIWEEVMGSPLTIVNNFPRNITQRNLLWSFTEFEFLPNRWSLRRVLKKILLSGMFNRKSPRISDGEFAYELPKYLDPWIANDPRRPPEALPGWQPGIPPTPDPAHTHQTDDQLRFHANAMGEGVHRYSPRSLLYSVHAALDWPPPPRFLSGAKYPSDALRKGIGQFYRDAEPGFGEVDFQGLLQWESVHGTCSKPGQDDDWIDRLMAAIEPFNQQHPSQPLTLRDLAQTMRDWTLSDATIDTGAPVGETGNEEAALEAFFDAPLTAVADVSTPAAREALAAKLRGYCGVLLETPQFLLAGIAPTQLGARPRLRVCNQEPCDYQAVCESLKEAMWQSGWDLQCQEDSLSAEPLEVVPVEDLDSLCPSGGCSFFARLAPDECLEDPLGCPPEPPACDPRCTSIGCCGEPLPAADQPGYLLAWADGGTVRKAKGVRVLRSGEDGFRPLKAGTKLAVGDWIDLPAGSRMTIHTKHRKLKTPKAGMPARGDLGAWRMLVTGASALQPTDEAGGSLPTPLGPFLRMQQAAWLKDGEAGAPRMAGQDPQFDPARFERQPEP